MSSAMYMRDATPMAYSLTDHASKTVEIIPAEGKYYKAGIQAYGCSVGPIPLSIITTRFMRVKGGFTAVPVPTDMFEGVVVTPEPKMQALWAKAVINAKVFKKFTLHHTSNSIDIFSEILNRPDLGVYSSYNDDDPDELHWSDLESLFELKPRDAQDPHVLDLDLEDSEVMTENDDSEQSQKARGQILIYVGALSGRQHRLFTFIFGIFGRHARSYIADPSGLAHSEKIGYVDDPMKLISLLQRFEQLTDEQRGKDTTVTLADPDEVAMFIKALETLSELASDGHPVRNFPKMAPADLKGIPKYKIPVRDDKTKKTYYYIICRPLRYPIFPFGHFSRTFLALRLDSDREESDSSDDEEDGDRVERTLNSLFLLGDMWRFSEGDALSEMDIYDELNGLGVPHLAPLLFGGDARTEKGKPQKTIVHQISQKEHDKNSGDKGFHRLKEQTHYRFVQKLAYPLNTFRNARELVQVIHDAYESLCEAFLLADRVHRGISEQSVMISATEYTDNSKTIARGLLGGWSNSRVFSSKGATRLFRETSWQFDSANLLQTPEKVQTIHDDCEALFWLLLHTAIHHCKHTGPVRHNIFDSYEEEDDEVDGTPRFVGGDKKINFLLRPTAKPSPEFKCFALQTLVTKLQGYWGNYYTLRQYKEKAAAKNPAEFDSVYASFANDPKQLLVHFKEVLEMGDAEWRDGEWYPDQYVQQTKSQRRRATANKRGSSTHSKINTRSTAATTTLHIIKEADEVDEVDETAEVEALLLENQEKEPNLAAGRVGTLNEAGDTRVPTQSDSTGGRKRNNAGYSLRTRPKQTEKARSGRP
ncbi:hypothetical protein K474DRAFT_138050 [Panus rudis PR-1116 ss-1]|nr:hypothetical protein K474DRAFT_138050 [Panus rudis PR-1116 ss-1]